MPDTDLILKYKQDVSDKLLDGEVFYYQGAINAWNVWKGLQFDTTILEKLSAISSEELKELYETKDSNIIKIREAMFRVVAFMDLHAKDKAKYQGTNEPRSIASTGIRQHYWVQFLAKNKLDAEIKSSGFNNMIKYLEYPDTEFPIVSDEHKKLIYRYFIGEPLTDDNQFAPKLKQYFKRFITCRNPLNLSIAITSVIYKMIDAWNDNRIKGLFYHDTDKDEWQDAAVAKASNNENGIILNWNSKPKDEILEQLRKIVEGGDTFDIYYLKDNKATHKAVVKDFSVGEEEYNQKDWGILEPAWYEKEYSEISGGNAKIVYFASSFEKLENPILWRNFVRYKDMTYNVRGGVCAFTKILSNRDINERNMIEDYKKIILTKHNVIFTGAPGTGKTYLAHQIAQSMIGLDKTEDLESCSQFAFVQFHPSYDYTDFVEGLRPIKSTDNNVGFKLKNGTFKEFCERAVGEPNKPYIFVIDEINRGEISKIFGELFFSIDPGYRGKKGAVLTQYANLHKDPTEKFYVPENVYIIGTMNDIDRSVESFDFAMRRRFTWLEITANASADTMPLSDDMKNRMKSLNKAIDAIEELNESYHIGGAYFLSASTPDDIWKMNLKPLLTEYLRGLPDAKESIKNLETAFKDPENADKDNGQ